MPPSPDSIGTNLRRRLARSRFCVRLAARIRNHAAAVINEALEDRYDFTQNGEEFLVTQIAPHARRFIDVGGNEGDWSEMFLRHAPPAVSGLIFEPSSHFHEKLRDRFGSRGNIEIVPSAVAAESGETDFFELPNTGKSSLLREWPKADEQQRTLNEQRVPMTTLDHEIEKRGSEPVDFLKIDIEGYDFFALKGARRTLARGGIDFVQFEFNRPWSLAGATLRQAMDLLHSCHYTVYVVRPTGLFEFPHALYREFTALTNFCAVSPGKRGEIGALIKGSF